MAHSVVLTNPIPTWEETAEFYGLSKADWEFVEGLFSKKDAAQSASRANKAHPVRISLTSAKRGKKRGNRNGRR